MKAIVIGTSLSGKTTLVRYLRNHTKLSVLEVDEELTRINGGEYPADHNFKHKILIPHIIKDIINRNNIVFFTNTDYFTDEELIQARNNGFKIIQLSLNLEELLKRNENRVKNEGYADLSRWLPGMVKYQMDIKEKGLVDLVIDGKQPTAKIADQLIEYLK